MAADPFNGFVLIAATNMNVLIQITDSNGLFNINGLFQTIGQTSGNQSFSGQGNIKLLVRSENPPEYIITVTPTVFPTVIVDIENATYDYLEVKKIKKKNNFLIFLNF